MLLSIVCQISSFHACIRRAQPSRTSLSMKLNTIQKSFAAVALTFALNADFNMEQLSFTPPSEHARGTEQRNKGNKRDIRYMTSRAYLSPHSSTSSTFSSFLPLHCLPSLPPSMIVIVKPTASLLCTSHSPITRLSNHPAHLSTVIMTIVVSMVMIIIIFSHPLLSQSRMWRRGIQDQTILPDT